MTNIITPPEFSGAPVVNRKTHGRPRGTLSFQMAARARRNQRAREAKAPALRAASEAMASAWLDSGHETELARLFGRCHGELSVCDKVAILSWLRSRLDRPCES